jgi:hypothetical protein
LLIVALVIVPVPDVMAALLKVTGAAKVMTSW